jgi:glycosyltransferase 2 family protein
VNATDDGSDVTIVEADVSATERSPSDFLRLVVALAVVVATMVVDWLFGETLAEFAAELLRGLDALPEWLLGAIVIATRLTAAIMLVAGVVVVVRRGRWRVLLTVASAAIVAALGAVLVNTLAPEPSAAVVDLDGFLLRSFPSSPGLAAASAAVTAAAPWLSRRWRRVGWTVVVVIGVAHFMTTPISLAALRAFLIGWLVGAVAVVVLGGPNRRPSGRSIAAGLADVGVPLARLEQASLDARGSTPYFGVARDGRRLFVKALGEDQRSADTLFRLYRRLQPRHLGDERPFSTLRRAVEHEALVALTASALGIRTPAVVAMATAEPNGFVLAYEAVDGRSLDRLEPDEVTDDLLRDIWSHVIELQTHRIAHRDLRLANIFVATGGDIWMIDFGFSELAASDLLLANDLAELLASSSLQVGSERAVGNAVAVAGGSRLAAAVPRLEPWALSGATRTGLKEHEGLIDDLRTRVVDAGRR